MSFLESLRSGKFAVYGQWSAYIALICMIIVPFTVLANAQLPFAIITWVLAFFVLAIEVPIFSYCFRADSTPDRLVKMCHKPISKGCVYSIFSALMWLSLVISASIILLPAIILSFTALCNLVAVFKREESAEHPFQKI